MNQLFVRFLFLVGVLAALTSALPHLYRDEWKYDTLKTQIQKTDRFETITQRLDHFDRSNDITFKQRYFIDDSYWSGKDDAPVFLCVGGEG